MEQMMGVEPNPEGWADWTAKLDGGMSREQVFNGFAGSEEFKNVCASAGIQAGTAQASGSTKQAGACSYEGCGKDPTAQIKDFVTRLYSVFLERDPDPEGLKNWTAKFFKGEVTGRSGAHGFVFSTEFTGKGYGNMEFLNHMYRGLLDRDPDEGGLNSWLQQMANGMTREQVFNGFASSQEFSDICSKYGITRG